MTKKSKKKYVPLEVKQAREEARLKAQRYMTVEERLARIVPIRDAVEAVSMGKAGGEEWTLILFTYNMLNAFTKKNLLKDEGWLGFAADKIEAVLRRDTACRYDELAALREMVEVFGLALEGVHSGLYERVSVEVYHEMLHPDKNDPEVRALPHPKPRNHA